MQNFLSRVTKNISQMKSYYKHFHDHIIVVKVLRSLILKFDLVATTIVELKDLSIFLFDELMGSFKHIKQGKQIT